MAAVETGHCKVCRAGSNPFRDKDLSAEQFFHAAHYLLASALTQTKNNLSPCPACKLAVWRLTGDPGCHRKSGVSVGKNVWIRLLCRRATRCGRSVHRYCLAAAPLSIASVRCWSNMAATTLATPFHWHVKCQKCCARCCSLPSSKQAVAHAVRVAATFADS